MMNDNDSMTVMISVVLILALFCLIGVVHANRKIGHLVYYEQKGMMSHSGAAIHTEARAALCRKHHGELDRNGVCVGIQGRHIALPGDVM